jgi:hypothetical protein
MPMDYIRLPSAQDRFSAALQSFSGFVPLVASGPYVANPILWVRSTGVLFQVSDGTTAVTVDTDPVGYWTDESGLGHHPIQASSTRRPLYKTNIFGSLPGILFDGSNDFLQAAFTLTTTIHAWFVVKPVTWATGKTIFAGKSGDEYDAHMASTEGVWAGWDGGSTATSGTTEASGAIVIIEHLKGSGGHIRVNHHTAANHSGTGSSNNADGLTIGSHPAPTAYCNAYVAECIAYNTALGSTDQETIWGSLNAIYGAY